MPLIDPFVRFGQNERIISTWKCSVKTYTANEAKTRFGEFIDEAQRQPVRVMRHDRVVGVMVSAQDYEAMRAFYSDRLRQTMNRASDAAERAGLTEEKLAELLADES